MPLPVQDIDRQIPAALADELLQARDNPFRIGARTLQVVAEQQHVERVFGVVLGDLHEVGHLFDAGRSPHGPQIEDHRAPAVRRQHALQAGEVDDFDARGHNLVLGRRFLRRPITCATSRRKTQRQGQERAHQAHSLSF
jgi:hypothetical protein